MFVKVVDLAVSRFSLEIYDIGEANEFSSMEAAIAFYRAKAVEDKKSNYDEEEYEENKEGIEAEIAEGYGMVARHSNGMALVSNGEESNWLLVPDGNKLFRDISDDMTDETEKELEVIWFDSSSWKAED